MLIKSRFTQKSIFPLLSNTCLIPKGKEMMIMGLSWRSTVSTTGVAFFPRVSKHIVKYFSEPILVSLARNWTMVFYVSNTIRQSRDESTYSASHTTSDINNPYGHKSWPRPWALCKSLERACLHFPLRPVTGNYWHPQTPYDSRHSTFQDIWENSLSMICSGWFAHTKSGGNQWPNWICSNPWRVKCSHSLSYTDSPRQIPMCLRKVKYSSIMGW